MTIYVASLEKNSPESLKNIKEYTENIIFYKKADELKNIEKPTLVLLPEEKIKFWNTETPFGDSYLTDGEWLVKDDRWLNRKEYAENERIIIKSGEYLRQPFLKYSNLVKLYQNKNYDNFCVEGEKLIFSYNETDIMLYYYLALVYFFILRKPEAAQAKISYVLNSQANFAEAWCLLGDMFTDLQKLGLAKQAYENAITKGAVRNIYDGNPVWLKKYGKYPKEMLAKIDKHINGSRIVLENHF